MEAAHAPETEVQTTPDVAAVGPQSDHARRCLVSGRMLPKEDLIRFVVGPDSTLYPDLAQDLPGRGLWVSADRTAITMAAAKNLFAKAAKTRVKASSDLADQVEKLLRARCLSLLGMAKKAGITILGEAQVEEGLRSHKIGLLLLAEDAKGNIDRRNPVAECQLFKRDELGSALGFAQIVYAGLKPHGLTTRLKTETRRLAKLTETAHIQKTSETDT